jgi:hypothetical protein
MERIGPRVMRGDWDERSRSVSHRGSFMLYCFRAFVSGSTLCLGLLCMNYTRPFIHDHGSEFE